MSMPLTCVAVTPDTVRELWARCRDIGFFAPMTEIWLLRLDMLLAFKRFGWHNRRAIAAYLLPGREDWGLE